MATTVANAALILNSPIAITHTLTVNPIIVSDDVGAMTATFMGTVSQETEIKQFVDTIWAQAGIDVAWGTPTTLNSTEVLDGSQGANGNTPRPTNDLSNDVGGADHQTIGAAVRQTNQINMFFVNIAAGFSLLTNDFVAGLAETPGDDVSIFVGMNLLTFANGREAIAATIAHEIAHNLSLDHNEVDENLLISGTVMGVIEGERLSATQVSAARAHGISSGLLVAVPEPSAFVFVGLIGMLFFAKKSVSSRAA